jgi:ribosomal protein S18 acetylase RimI-like enzyme
VDLRVTDQLAGRLDAVLGFLEGPRLWVPRQDYPDFMDWLHKAHGELQTGQKRAVVCLEGPQVLGSVIYQPHRALRGVLELKNISVRPEARGRLLASFLLRQAELAGIALGLRTVTVDAKARNFGIRSFLLSQRYRPSNITDLYGLGAGDDIVYTKVLRSRL